MRKELKMKNVMFSSFFGGLGGWRGSVDAAKFTAGWVEGKKWILCIFAKHCRNPSELLQNLWEGVRAYMCFSHSDLFGRIWVSFWLSAAQGKCTLPVWWWGSGRHAEFLVSFITNGAAKKSLSPPTPGVSCVWVREIIAVPLAGGWICERGLFYILLDGDPILHCLYCFSFFGSPDSRQGNFP